MTAIDIIKSDVIFRKHGCDVPMMMSSTQNQFQTLVNTNLRAKLGVCMILV